MDSEGDLWGSGANDYCRLDLDGGDGGAFGLSSDRADDEHDEMRENREEGVKG